MTDINKKYPSLDKITEEIYFELIETINSRVKNIISDMPYKGQYVLEELIKKLEKSV